MPQAHRIAKLDVDNGRVLRAANEFRARHCGNVCDLCLKGPFVNAYQRHKHDSSFEHRDNYSRYVRTYLELREVNLLLPKLRVMRGLMASPFWCGDLCKMKAATLDWLISKNGARFPTQTLPEIDRAFSRHVLREQSHLLLLAFVRGALCAESGSVDQGRTATTNADHGGDLWKARIRAAGAEGYLLLSLIMPYVRDGKAGDSPTLNSLLIPSTRASPPGPVVPLGWAEALPARLSLGSLLLM